MTLTKRQVRDVKIVLSLRGINLPKMGYVITIPEADRGSLKLALGTHYPPTKVVRDAGGYYVMF